MEMISPEVNVSRISARSGGKSLFIAPYVLQQDLGRLIYGDKYKYCTETVP